MSLPRFWNTNRGSAKHCRVPQRSRDKRAGSPASQSSFLSQGSHPPRTGARPSTRSSPAAKIIRREGWHFNWFSGSLRSLGWLVTVIVRVEHFWFMREVGTSVIFSLRTLTGSDKDYLHPPSSLSDLPSFISVIKRQTLGCTVSVQSIVVTSHTQSSLHWIFNTSPPAWHQQPNGKQVLNRSLKNIIIKETCWMI